MEAKSLLSHKWVFVAVGYALAAAVSLLVQP